MYKSEKFWNKLSKNYNKNAKDAAFDKILNKSEKFLKKDHVLLDFACATGLYSFRFADNVKEIHAFDISSEMISIAKNEAKHMSLNNISFSHTTLFDQKFKNGAFDSILAFNVLLYFEDQDKVFNRIYELLKPNGVLITSTACLKEKRTFVGILSSGIIFLLSKIRIIPYIKFLKMAELEDTIKSNGFNIIEKDILMDNPATEYFIVAQK